MKTINFYLLLCLLTSISTICHAQWLNVTNGIYYNSGNVGIGTTDPQATLDVVGTLRISKPNLINNWNNVLQSGFYDSYDVPNSPETSQWFWGIHMGHRNNYGPTNRYGGQIAILNSPYFPKIYFRSVDASGNGTWAKILHNVGTQEINGTLRAHEVRVCLTAGCDYVFADDYKLMNLNDLSSFIKTNKHLPEIAPAAEMEAEGINLSEMNALLLKKIEELTLYVIQQQEMMDKLQSEIQDIKINKL